MKALPFVGCPFQPDDEKDEQRYEEQLQKAQRLLE